MSLKSIFRRHSTKYESLTFNFSCEDLKDLIEIEMASDTFRDNNWYKITNAGDGSVIELTGKLLICNPESEDREEFQTFKALSLGKGHFEIKSLYQKPPGTLVWDYTPHGKALAQRPKNKKSDSGNQRWITETVTGMQSTNLILSAPELTKCLRNMGSGKQIKLVPKTNEIITDKFCHWKLQSLQPSSGKGRRSSDEDEVEMPSTSAAVVTVPTPEPTVAGAVVVTTPVEPIPSSMPTLPPDLTTSPVLTPTLSTTSIATLQRPCAPPPPPPPPKAVSVPIPVASQTPTAVVSTAVTTNELPPVAAVMGGSNTQTIMSSVNINHIQAPSIAPAIVGTPFVITSAIVTSGATILPSGPPIVVMMEEVSEVSKQETLPQLPDIIPQVEPMETDEQPPPPPVTSA